MKQAKHTHILAGATVLFAVLAFFLALRLDAAGPGSALLIALTLTVFAALAVFALLYRFGTFEPRLVWPALAAMGLLLLLRLLCFDHETGDYLTFLKPWTQYYRDNGGFAGLGRSMGNYNIPYLVFLALFSYIPVSELYLIKLLSVGFDLLLAVSLAGIVLHLSGSRPRATIAFALALLLPTVLLNGAYWGQCDSIYGGLAVLSLYFMLTDRPWHAMAALALSFAFKLQAVFLFPVYVVFFFTGRLKLRHLPLFPAVYFLAVSPAMLAGRPVPDTLLLYVDQGSTVGSALNYNSPSIYALFRSAANPEQAASYGILAAFLFCALLFLLLLFLRKRLDNPAMLILSVLFVIAVPLLLPHMHERYFFLADVLTLALACIFPAVAPIVPLSSFASLLGYHAYLQGRYFWPMSRGCLALLLTLLVLFVLLFRQLRADDDGGFH